MVARVVRYVVHPGTLYLPYMAFFNTTISFLNHTYIIREAHELEHIKRRVGLPAFDGSID